MEISPPRHLFELDAGRLSLDFANTVGGMRDVAPKERLAGYLDLLEFARQAGVVSDEHAQRLRLRAEKSPEEAAAAFRRAVALREATYRVWQAHVRGDAPAQPDLDALTAAYTRAMTRLRLVPATAERCCALGWEETDDPEVLLWPIAKDAVELLTSEQAARVRICEASSTHECSWVFLDETRNRSRRWCSMASCGNRAKVRRHYQKERQG